VTESPIVAWLTGAAVNQAIAKAAKSLAEGKSEDVIAQVGSLVEENALLKSDNAVLRNENASLSKRLAKWQRRDWEHKKLHFPKGTFCLVADFAERGKLDEWKLEPQAKYFSGKSYAIFPMVVYLHLEDCTHMEDILILVMVIVT
jgi:hypothetical protein